MATKPEKTKFQRYEERKREKGYVKIHPWVPFEEREAIEKYIARKCKAHEKARA